MNENSFLHTHFIKSLARILLSKVDYLLTTIAPYFHFAPLRALCGSTSKHYSSEPRAADGVGTRRINHMMTTKPPQIP